jgi:hypothetical protein
MARQNAAICVNDKSLFPDVVYHTTAWWLLVFHMTGDLTVTLKFGPVVDMTKRTVNVVTPLLPLGKWGAVNNKAAIVEPKDPYHQVAWSAPGSSCSTCTHGDPYIYSKFAGRNLHLRAFFGRKLWKTHGVHFRSRTFTFSPRRDMGHVSVETIKKYLR